MGEARSAKRAILIAGPTASGKSALALTLAEAHGGTVINADAMQVFADLRILTARPPPEETARVPHRLFGHVDAGEPTSVGRWLAEVRAALDECFATGRLPVIVGGTGLYIKALTQGLSALPDIPDTVRARVRAEGAGRPPEALHARLAAIDPATAARLRPTDPQRILRALEVFEATGQSLAALQGRREPAVLPMRDIAGVVIDLPRPTLNMRIDRRFDAMVDAGALDEVRALRARALDPDSPVLRALGVPQLTAALDGRVTLAEAMSAAKTLSRQYAKRQLTFARHQLPDLTWAPPERASDVVKSALKE